MAAARRLAWMALPLALPLVLLAACNQADETVAPAGKRAAGEVLGGTINDEMIPLEQLRSQSPPMRAVPGEGDDSSDSSASGGSSASGAGAESSSADTGSAAAPSPDDTPPDPAPAEEG